MERIRSARTVARRGSNCRSITPRKLSVLIPKSISCTSVTYPLVSQLWNGTKIKPASGKTLNAFSSLLASLHDHPLPSGTRLNKAGLAGSETSKSETVVRLVSIPSASSRLPIGCK